MDDAPPPGLDGVLLIQPIETTVLEAVALRWWAHCQRDPALFLAGLMIYALAIVQSPEGTPPLDLSAMRRDGAIIRAGRAALAVLGEYRTG
jgi:hypothetical protein